MEVAYPKDCFQAEIIVYFDFSHPFILFFLSGKSCSFDFFSAGHDMKSLALNFFSTVLFILPFVAYFYTERLQEAIIVVAASLVIALLVPPIGWRRPHPYSDDPNNVPYPRKSE